MILTKLAGFVPPQYQIIAIAGAAALTFGTGLAVGWKIESWRWSAAENHALKKEIKVQQKQTEVVHEQSTNFEKEHTDAAEQATTRETQIKVIYRDRKIVVPAACEPPADAIGVLNDAVRSASARARGEPGDPVSGATGDSHPVRRP